MRTLLLGDLHLSTHTPHAVSVDLVRLLEAHRGARVIFAGDFFDLSADAPRLAIGDGFSAHPMVASALAEHLEKNGEIVWLAGNHDADIASPETIATALRLSNDAKKRVRTSPWFFKQGALHVEHGHLYDPDNAPPHPLASPRSTLGVHFVEQFIATTGAYAFLNASDKPPLQLFWNSFRWYGVRGPYVVYRYFRTAFSALAQSGSFGAPTREKDRARAEASLADFLVQAGVDERFAEDLAFERATPTMTSFGDTFARLYLDRVAATAAILAGLSAFALGKKSLAIALGSAGLAGLAFSWARGHDRYGGRVPEQLDAAASRIARASGSSLVVFGHAHEITDRAGYSNTASFAFPRGDKARPFLEIEGPEDSPRAVRRFVQPGAKIIT